ncbi:abortive infection protein [Methylomonas lenta]|uniref:Abortive infection protein n=1 Tax=Methylomonas lenta TaxID=980561 RepID=A0A177NTD7_9GAMM|nr:CPBP family intramembrane glutamic endopeptidase [Methylomonas lenta]OAI21337.1 abortive infection protein [Methylomonas lenta]
MRYLIIALAPLAWLLLLAMSACLLGFGLLQLTGDVLPLAKVVSRLTLILLLISIFPLRKALHLSWQDLGFATCPVFFRQVGYGFLLAVITLLPVLIVLYGLDVHVWDLSRVWTLAKIVEKTGLALLFALLIAINEEILFRGLLLSALRRHFSLVVAIAISSFYYAALHFLKSRGQIPYDQQTLSSGFELMAEAFANWLNPDIVSALIALFVVGVFLAILRSHIPQSLGLTIGCHAGWVWQIKLSKDLFNVNPQADYLYLVSAYDGVVGPLVSVWLVIAIMVWLKMQQKSVIRA